MTIHPTAIGGVVVVTTDIFMDERGTFARCYCEKELAEVTGNHRIVQINISRTNLPGTIRGLHFQSPPNAEIKLIRCIKGRVWDVVVDLRAGSPTFLKWHAEELSPDSATMLVIPEGCAHGFQVLEENSELLYLQTAFYAPESEAGIMYNDPEINIKWPLEVTELSRRDTLHPLIDSNYKGILI